jgi:hypothetical protein
MMQKSLSVLVYCVLVAACVGTTAVSALVDLKDGDTYDMKAYDAYGRCSTARVADLTDDFRSAPATSKYHKFVFFLFLIVTACAYATFFVFQNS